MIEQKKKFSKSKMTDLVWTLWTGYVQETDEFPEWGSFLDEDDRDAARVKVIDYVTTTIDVTRLDVESVLHAIEHTRECSVYDEQDVNKKIREWRGELFDAQGKRESDAGCERLRTTIDRLVETYDPHNVSLWEASVYEVLVKMGVPKRELNCLVHYGRISKLDDEYRVRRTEIYEQLLRKNSKHVKE